MHKRLVTRGSSFLDLSPALQVVRVKLAVHFCSGRRSGLSGSQTLEHDNRAIDRLVVVKHDSRSWKRFSRLAASVSSPPPHPGSGNTASRLKGGTQATCWGLLKSPSNAGAGGSVSNFQMSMERAKPQTF